MTLLILANKRPGQITEVNPEIQRSETHCLVLTVFNIVATGGIRGTRKQIFYDPPNLAVLNTETSKFLTLKMDFLPNP